MSTKYFAIFAFIAVMAVQPNVLFAEEVVTEENLSVVRAVEEEAKDVVEEVAPPVSTIWDQFPPTVQVIQWGPNLRILFEPNPAMSPQQIGAIESVQFENKDGEFLGLKTYTVKEVTRRAEFMIDPSKLEIESGQLVIKSKIDGEHVMKFDLTNPEAPPKPKVTKPAVSTTNVRVAAPKKVEQKKKEVKEAKEEKKKRWLW